MLKAELEHNKYTSFQFDRSDDPRVIRRKIDVMIAKAFRLLLASENVPVFFLQELQDLSKKWQSKIYEWRGASFLFKILHLICCWTMVIEFLGH